MSIEEIEAKFKELEDATEVLEQADDSFNDFIASLKELVY